MDDGRAADNELEFLAPISDTTLIRLSSEQNESYSKQ